MNTTVRRISEISQRVLEQQKRKQPMSTNIETIRVEQANRSQYNAEQVRVKDHNGRWLSGWDAQLLNTVGLELSVEVKTVQKGDKTYHNIRSFNVVGGDTLQAVSAPPPAPVAGGHARPPVSAVSGRAAEPEAFSSARSMEILYQTCLKEVCASIGLTLDNVDSITDLSVRLAHSLRDTAQEKPENLRQQQQDMAAQAADDDNDIPF